MRRRVPRVRSAGRPLLVGALGALADPVRPVADHGRQLGRGVALRQQPQNLPPGALVGLFRRPIAVLEFFHAQMRLEMNTSGHAAILPPPTNNPYDAKLSSRGVRVAALQPSDILQRILV